MGFLAPLFLLSLLGLALPIWLHRLQSMSSERQLFSSAMLLERAEQRVHVRRKIKYRWLLALRIALLTCLAIAFAKPFVANPPMGAIATAAGTQLIAIDVSASMGRADVFADSRTKARELIALAPAGAVKQLLAAGRDILIVTEPSTERGVHSNAVAALEPGEERADFGQLMAAADRLAEYLPAPVSLHVISDFQQSAMPTRFSDLGTRHLSAFMPHLVEATAIPNRGIEFIRSNLPAGSMQGQERVIEVGLSAAAGETVQLKLNDDVVGRKQASEGTSSTLKFEGLVAVDGDNRVEARLLQGDGFVVDDTRFHVFERMPPQRIAVLTADTAGLGFTYLASALASGGEFVAEPVMVGEFDPRVLARYRLLLIEDVGAIDGALEAALMEWIMDGGQILGFAGAATATLGRLPVSHLAVSPALARARQQAFLSPAQIDGDHPLLAQTEGWQSVKFGKVLPVEPGSDDEILVALDDGTPLILETPLGRGKVMTVTAALHDRSNDFPIRAVFVGFIVEAARYLTGASSLSRAFTVGDGLARFESAVGGGQVIDPDGNPLLSLGGALADVRLNQSGIYTVYTTNKEYSIAVNTDLRESQFASVDAQTLADWVKLTGTNAVAPIEDNVRLPADAGAQNVMELWPWALVLLMALVIGESLLGNAYFAGSARS
jgi:hypothetical protein